MSRASQKAWFDRRQQINTWLLKSDFSRLARVAEAHGETPSSFARQAILVALEQVATPPSPSRVREVEDA